MASVGLKDGASEGPRAGGATKTVAAASRAVGQGLAGRLGSSPETVKNILRKVV